MRTLISVSDPLDEDALAAAAVELAVEVLGERPHPEIQALPVS
jgi:hypothetical protein